MRAQNQARTMSPTENITLPTVSYHPGTAHTQYEYEYEYEYKYSYTAPRVSYSLTPLLLSLEMDSFLLAAHSRLTGVTIPAQRRHSVRCEVQLREVAPVHRTRWLRLNQSYSGLNRAIACLAVQPVPFRRSKNRLRPFSPHPNLNVRKLAVLLGVWPVIYDL